MLPHTITPLGNGMVSLNIQLSSAMALPVLHAFTAMTDLARSTQIKTKTVTAPERLQEQNDKNKEYYQNYKNAITDKFNKLYLMKADVKECIKETNKQIKLIYPNTSHDGVKRILTESGLLKNKGYNTRKINLTDSQ